MSWDPSDKNRMASTAGDKNVRVWDVRDHKAKSSVPLSEECFDVAYSSDGNFVSVSNKQRINLIDCRKWRVVSQSVLPVEINETKFCGAEYLIVAAGHPSGHGTFEVLKLKYEDGISISLSHIEEVYFQVTVR